MNSSNGCKCIQYSYFNMVFSSKVFKGVQSSFLSIYVDTEHKIYEQYLDPGYLEALLCSLDIGLRDRSIIVS